MLTPPNYEDIQPGHKAVRNQLLSGNMEYIGVTELAKSMGLTPQAIRFRLKQGGLPGSIKSAHNRWLIPSCYTDQRLWFEQATYAKLPQRKDDTYPPTPETLDKITTASIMWSQGYTFIEIGKAIDRHPDTIRRWWSKYPASWRRALLETKLIPLRKSCTHVPPKEERPKTPSELYLEPPPPPTYKPFRKGIHAISRLDDLFWGRKSHLPVFSYQLNELAEAIRDGSQFDQESLLQILTTLGILDKIKQGLIDRGIEIATPKDPDGNTETV